LFTTHPDLAHYLAWFVPGERGYLDSRLTLFTGVAGEFQELSRSLGLLPDRPTTGSNEPSPQDIVAVALYDPDPFRTTLAIHSIAKGEAGPWRVARIDATSLFLVSSLSPRSGSDFDAERAAFSGTLVRTAGSRLPVLSDTPGNDWLSRLIPPRGYRVGSAEAGSATIYLRLFDASKSTSPALPLLAVRAARLATENEPRDPTAWLVLARGYLSLAERSGEREGGEELTLLQTVRLVQTTTALTQAVIHGPDSVAARETLAGVLARRNALDLAHRHAAEALRLTRRAGPLAGESAEGFSERVRLLAARTEELEAAVFESENRFLIRTFGLGGDPLTRARIAGESGLPQKAIDVLLASHPDLYGGEGLSLLADLLLQTGQAAECRHLLDRDELRRNPETLGVATIPGRPHPDGHTWAYRLPAYDWYDLCQCAAAGNYPGAGAAFDRIGEHLGALERTGTPYLSELILRQFRADLAFFAPPSSPLARLAGERERHHLLEYLRHTKFFSVARADLQTLAGILETERGAVESAAGRFGAALGLYESRRGIAPALPGERLATRYHQALRKQHWP
jgi:hypothetical protein